MPLPGSPSLNRLVDDQRKINKPIDAPKIMLKQFMPSIQGWATREGMRLATIGITSLAVWEKAKGVPDSVVGPQSMALLAAAAYAINVGFSLYTHSVNKEK